MYDRYLCHILWDAKGYKFAKVYHDIRVKVQLIESIMTYD